MQAKKNTPEIYGLLAEFADPETGQKWTAGSASALQADYGRLFDAHVEAVRQAGASMRWSHILHRTDRLASQALAALHNRLGESGWERAA